MSCQTNSKRVSICGVGAGIARLAGQAAYLVPVLAGGAMGLTTYMRSVAAEAKLDQTVAQSLAHVRASSMLAYEAMWRGEAGREMGFQQVAAHLASAQDLVARLPDKPYANVVSGALLDQIAGLKAGLDLHEQARVARPKNQPLLLAHVSSTFMRGFTANQPLFFARPSLAGQKALLAGGGAALAVAGGLAAAQVYRRWQAQRRRAGSGLAVKTRPLAKKSEGVKIQP